MPASIVNHRRCLHRIPELDDCLPETTAYVRAVLEPLGGEISTAASVRFLTRGGQRRRPFGRIWTPCR